MRKKGGRRRGVMRENKSVMIIRSVFFMLRERDAYTLLGRRNELRLGSWQCKWENGVQ